MTDDDIPVFDPDSVEFKDYDGMIQPAKDPEHPFTTIGKAWGSGVSQGVMDKDRIRAAVQVEWDKKKELEKEKKDAESDLWSSVLGAIWILYYIGTFVVYTLMITSKVSFEFFLIYAGAPVFLLMLIVPVVIGVAIAIGIASGIIFSFKQIIGLHSEEE